MAISSAATNLLGALLPEWHLLLQGWSADGRLTAAAQEALLLNGEPQALKDLTTQWSAGEFGGLPPIVLLSAADINGAMGAYAISTGTIYLNADWLEGATKEQVLSVLTEDLGYHLDRLLNDVDTPGDEGEYFLALLNKPVATRLGSNAISNTLGIGSLSSNRFESSVENPANNGAAVFKVSGIAQPGSLLQINEIYPDGDGGGAYVYQWYDLIRFLSVSSSRFWGASSSIIVPQVSPSALFVRVTYIDGAGNLESINLNVVESIENDYPRDIALSTNSVVEGSRNIAIANIISSDPNANDTISYSLVLGSGGEDGSSFSILGSQLIFNGELDFEAKAEYLIRIRATDGLGLYADSNQKISILDINETPTGLSLSATSFNESLSPGAIVATLSSTDPDAAEIFTYTLVSGAGDTDNADFSITGNQLKINTFPNFESKYSYSVRVRSSDAYGLFTEKTFTLSVNDLNENPTDITFASAGVLENSADSTVIGTLSATDPDSEFSFTYALVAGNGTNDADNALVEIVGNQVRVKSGAVIDFEANPVLNLNIRVTDNGTPGLIYTKAVTAAVLDVLEDTTAPTITSISTQGTTVILRFSESVSAASVPTTRFSVATVNSASQVTNRTISTIALDQNDPTRVILTLTGTAPASTVNLRVSYTDPANNQTTAVVQDAAGNDVASFSNRFADTFITAATTTLASQYKNLVLNGTASINGTGNTLNNVLTGNSANNILSGGAGVDNMGGGLGNDTYVVDNAGDVVTEAAAEGADTVQSSVTYTLCANVENLTLAGSAAINGTGNGLNNVLTGNTAANVLTGGLGNDTYVTGAGDTVVEASAAGTDTVQTALTYSIAALANLENISLTGSIAVNATGNGSINTLTGNSANNVLVGGAGGDVLTGALGADVFRMSSLADSRLATMDRITDFAISTDSIDSVTAVSAANTKECGSVSTFDQAGISAVLTTSVFGANQAATFKFGTRTFVVLNDATAGFSSTADGLIEITGFTGLLTNLAIV